MFIQDVSVSVTCLFRMCLSLLHVYSGSIIHCYMFIQDVSFTVNPGEVVALVGPSGAGKSTCIHLLERFYEPDLGQVLLDGRPLANYQHKYLHTQVIRENRLTGV